MSKFDQYILKLLKAGLYLSLIAPLLMFSSLMYPFVTSKIFFFRILIEILTGVYFYLAYKYKELRPKINFLFFSLLGYSLILLISAFFGVDFNLSFWGDLERMGGIFTWLHFIVYFIILISVFKTEKEWINYIIATVGISFVATIYGLAQKFNWWGVYNAGTGRIDSTTGNPSFLAAYLIFHFFFSFFLFLKIKKNIWRVALGGLMILQILSVIYTGTRGAYLGIAAGFFIFVFLNIILSNNRRLSIVLGSLTILFLGFYLILFLNSAAVVKKIPSLYRAFDVSLSDPTVNTRFLAWEAAWQGFKDRPVLGVGLENFAIIFDKYFSPSFYTFTPTQTYFDRPHNVVFEHLSTVGMLGLLSYLLIFGATLFYLVKSLKKGFLSHLLFSGFVSLLVAYFIQNLFVFDSLNSYLPFFLVLGLTEFLSVPPSFGEAPSIEPKKDLNKNNLWPVFVFAAVILYLIYSFNIEPILAVRQVKKAEYLVQKQADLAGGVEYYKKALNYKTPLDRDIRTMLVTAVGLNIVRQAPNLSKEDINDFFDLSIGEMKKNLAYNPQDNFFNLKLGELYNLWSDYNKKEPQEAEFYLNEAIKASPGRLTGYYVLSQSKLLRKNFDEAISIARKAIEMNPMFSHGYWHLAKAYYVADKDTEAIKEIKAALLLGYNFTDIKDIEELINRYYERGEYRMIITLLHQAISLKSGEPLYYGRLAMAYAAIDDKENAQKYIQRVLDLDSGYAAEVQLFLEKLGKGELKK